MNAKFFTQKKGPLPVWAWALVGAVIIYVLYRHFQNSGGSSGSSVSSTPADMSLGNVAQTPVAPGDLTSNDPGNAANDPLAADFYPDNKVAQAGERLREAAVAFKDQADAIAGDLNNSQGDVTGTAADTSNQPGASTAPMGLVHISGDYWWDTDNHKLVKIPGSGKNGKATPNTTKKSGTKKRPPKKIRISPGKKFTGGKKNPNTQRVMRSPGSKVKVKHLPVAHNNKPTTPARRAIAHTQPVTKHPPVKRRSQPRQLPRRVGPAPSRRN